MLKNRLKKTLIDLFEFNEVYPEEKEIIKYVCTRLEKANVAYQLDSFKNIIAKIPGSGDPIMLCTHLDIPEPAPNLKFVEEGDILRSDGAGILGVDPKTGVAILLELIDDLAKENLSNSPLEIVFTRGEEVGLLGAKNLDLSLIKSKIGLVLDEDGPVTQVVIQAPSFVKIDAKIVGKAAHPREPKDGINALQAAAEAITQVPLGFSTPGVTWNIGILKSGTARNTIPGSAEIIAEMRSYDTDLVVSEGKRVKEIFQNSCTRLGAKCDFSDSLELEGYKLETSSPLFKKLETSFAQMGLKPNYFATFGGSDANIFNAKGITCVPIGSGYYNAHQYSEYADLADMVQIVDFLKLFVKKGQYYRTMIIQS